MTNSKFGIFDIHGHLPLRVGRHFSTGPPELLGPRSPARKYAQVACNGGYVLVVDDDLAIQRTLAAILSDDFGHNIKTASDGCEALEILAASSLPSLVLVDLIMVPGMDGARFIERKSIQPGLVEVPFCVMTASRWSGPELARLALQTKQEFPVLHKPFDMDELLSIVERYC